MNLRFLSREIVGWVFIPSSDHSRCLQAIPHMKVHARHYKTDPKRIALNRRFKLSPQSETNSEPVGETSPSRARRKGRDWQFPSGKREQVSNFSAAGKNGVIAAQSSVTNEIGSHDPLSLFVPVLIGSQRGALERYADRSYGRSRAARRDPALLNVVSARRGCKRQ